MKLLKYSQIHKLAIPALISGIAEPILSITDTAIVGNVNYNSMEALGAVGIVGTFLSMLTALLFLAAPFGYIVLNTPDGPREVLPYSLGVVPFTALLFVVGCSMGIGKAAVFKHIPEYFPNDVGAVGGLVGTLGALGGFLLPPLFVAVREWTGLPQSTFVVLFLLTLAATVWMHVVVVKMLHKASPTLKNQIDYNDSHMNGA